MNDKIKKIINNIENMKDWKWILITFCICLIFYLSISIKILWEPYIFAEDGAIFITEAINDGWKSINNTYGGYISVIPRLIALVAVYIGRNNNSLYLITFIMKWLSILFVTICINYINTENYKDIFKNRLLRLGISLMLLFVMSNQNFMIYNATYTHWWGGMLAFVIGIGIVNKKLPPTYILPILVLAILTSPSAILIAFPLLYYIILELKSILKDKKYGNKIEIKRKDIIIIGIIGLAILLQCYEMLFKAKEVTNQAVTLNLFELSESIVKAFFTNFTSVLTCGQSEKLPRGMDILIGLTIYGLLLYRNVKNKSSKLFIYCNLEMVLILFMSMYKNEEVRALPYVWLNWYNSIPIFSVVFLIIKTVYDEIKNNKNIFKYCAFSAFAVYFIAFYVNTYKPDYSFCKNVFDIESKVNFSSSYTVEVPISGGYYPKIPIVHGEG